MSRASYLSDEEKKDIENWTTDIYLKNRTDPAKQIHEKVNKKCIEKYGREISLSTIQPTITKLNHKNRAGELEFPIDKPWSLGNSFIHYERNIPIYPEAIPRILEIQKTANFPITIRRARWISYLSSSIEDDDALKVISFGYAYLELVADILGSNEFDTSEYDIYLSDKSQRKILIDKFMRLMVSDTDNHKTKAISFLTLNQLTEPIREVVFRDKKAYAIYQNSELELGPQMPWLGFLKVKKYLPLLYLPLQGVPVKLPRAFLPTNKQLQKLQKEAQNEGTHNQEGKE